VNYRHDEHVFSFNSVDDPVTVTEQMSMLFVFIFPDQSAHVGKICEPIDRFEHFRRNNGSVALITGLDVTNDVFEIGNSLI
jgi:hypothetical protein